MFVGDYVVFFIPPGTRSVLLLYLFWFVKYLLQMFDSVVQAPSLGAESVSLLRLGKQSLVSEDHGPGPSFQ